MFLYVTEATKINNMKQHTNYSTEGSYCCLSHFCSYCGFTEITHSYDIIVYCKTDVKKDQNQDITQFCPNLWLMHFLSPEDN